MNSFLALHAASIAEELCGRLVARSGSVFDALGARKTRDIADGVVAALEKDLSSGGEKAARGELAKLIEELSPQGLGYADLRHLLVSLRQILFAVLSNAEQLFPTARQEVEQWLFHVVLATAARFVATREWAFQEQAAHLQVGHVEGRLVELQAAYDEKTRLLEQIRQASTPIAPIYEGILVVPIVGILDAFRAQVLTEKLLEAIIAKQAQVVILDVSGVPVFDAETAQNVLGTTKAARLLGTELILVGLSPQVARTVVDSGLDLEGLETRATLQAGLAKAFSLCGLRIVQASGVRRK